MHLLISAINKFPTDSNTNETSLNNTYKIWWLSSRNYTSLCIHTCIYVYMKTYTYIFSSTTDKNINCKEMSSSYYKITLDVYIFSRLYCPHIWQNYNCLVTLVKLQLLTTLVAEFYKLMYQPISTRNGVLYHVHYIWNCFKTPLYFPYSLKKHHHNFIKLNSLFHPIIILILKFLTNLSEDEILWIKFINALRCPIWCFANVFIIFGCKTLKSSSLYRKYS